MKNLLLLFLLISTVSTAQIKDFFKYSTFYTSMSMNTSFVEREDYRAVLKGYEDITLNKLNILDDPRIVASKVNELNLLNNENSWNSYRMHGLPTECIEVL